MSELDSMSKMACSFCWGVGLPPPFTVPGLIIGGAGNKSLGLYQAPVISVLSTPLHFTKTGSFLSSKSIFPIVPTLP